MEKNTVVYAVIALVIGSLILNTIYLEKKMGEQEELIQNNERLIQQNYDNISLLKRQKAELLSEIKFLDYTYKAVDLTYVSTYIKPENPEIQTLAASLGSPEAIYYFVRDDITYLEGTRTHSRDLEVLQMGKGDCVGIADLLCSLLRAYGFSGNDVHVVIGTVTYGGYRYPHTWIECYHNNHWLVLDATQYLGDFSFEQWDRNAFYEYFSADNYFEYNDKYSMIVGKVDPYKP